MSREIKFRFWLGHIGKMTYEHSLSEVGNIIKKFTDDIIPLQYTGLKDKNGKEIYEGDIWHDDGIVGKVIFDECSFKIKWRNGSKGDLHTNVTTSLIGKLIGNIYENPELLTF